MKKFIYFCPNSDCIFIRFWFSRQFHHCPECEKPLLPQSEGKRITKEIVAGKRLTRWQVEKKQALPDRDSEADCRKIHRNYCWSETCYLIEVMTVGPKLSSRCSCCGDDGFLIFRKPGNELLKKLMCAGPKQKTLFPPPESKSRPKEKVTIKRYLPTAYETEKASCGYRYRDRRDGCSLPRVKGERLCIKHKLILLFKKTWRNIWLEDLDDEQRKNYGICICGEKADPENIHFRCWDCAKKIEASKWWDD